MEETLKKQSWTPIEREYVRTHYTSQTPEQMADYLCKSVIAVEQFILRNRLAIPRIKRNIVIEMLTSKFVNPEYFRPTRAFYNATEINQRRWWDLYYGRKQITPKEYISICEHLKISLKEAFESRQLTITND